MGDFNFMMETLASLACKFIPIILSIFHFFLIIGAVHHFNTAMDTPTAW